MKPFDEERDKSEDKYPYTNKDEAKLIKKYTQHLSNGLDMQAIDSLNETLNTRNTYIDNLAHKILNGPFLTIT